jgi:hypothetical protein
MRLKLRIVGGFTGEAGADTRQVDFDRLPTSVATRLHSLVQRADPFSLPPTLKKSTPQPWDFRYTLTVEDGNRHHTIVFHKDAVSPALRELVEALEALEPDS